MSLANIKGKLSRAEMKQIMAGSDSGGTCTKTCKSPGGNLTCSGTDCTIAADSCYNWSTCA